MTTTGSPNPSPPSLPVAIPPSPSTPEGDVVTAAQDDRLYGVPGSENLHQDIGGAYESHVEPYLDERDRRPRVIEEWTVLPPGSTVRAAVDIVEWLIEDAADDAPEGFYDSIAHLDRDPDVLAAAEALRGAIIKRATDYWIADKRVAEHTITWDDAGEPLVNGKPLYVRAPSQTSAPVDVAPDASLSDDPAQTEAPDA